MVAISPFSLFHYLTADINSDCDRPHSTDASFNEWTLIRPDTFRVGLRVAELWSPQRFDPPRCRDPTSRVSAFPPCGKFSPTYYRILTSVSNASSETRITCQRRRTAGRRCRIGLTVIRRRQTIKRRGSQTYQGTSSLACRVLMRISITFKRVRYFLRSLFFISQ